MLLCVVVCCRSCLLLVLVDCCCLLRDGLVWVLVVCLGCCDVLSCLLLLV